ncbi:MAG: sugar phosphate isomerase/epimerase [Planctomycetes bacterium]|nr:sugar phosphate isomerase/epimerase [Planctomycetota bacterium]
MARINAVSFHHDPSIERICRTVREAGFDSLELSRPPFFEKLITTGTRKAFAAWARKLGLSLYGFDCWVEVDPYQAREKTLNGFKAAVEFAADLGLGLVISHDPWKHVNRGRSASECLRINIDFFSEVADLAAQKGLALVFEPHPDTLSMDNSWAIEFIDGLGRKNAGLLYDCCHYGVGQPEDYIRAIEILGQRIHHLHFSDGDRRTYALHLPLGEGELDLPAIVGALKAIRFGGTLTNDMYNYPLLEDGARRNVEKIRQVERELGIASA